MNNTLLSKDFKLSYLDSLKNLQRDLDKITTALSNLKDHKDESSIDKLLDLYNYTKASYQVLSMQYLILFITLLLKEKKIIQDDNIPLDTSLDILLKQKWIKDDNKNFLKLNFKKALLDNVDYSQYVTDLNTYLNNSNIFRLGD